MMPGMVNPQWRAFWIKQCPMRGPALTHMHDRDCEEHPRNMCCYCGQSVGAPTPNIARMSPIDMRRRHEIREAGIPPEADTVDDIRGLPDAQIHEPRMARGWLPSDLPANGPGRGRLTEGQMAYLVAIDKQVGSRR